MRRLRTGYRDGRDASLAFRQQTAHHSPVALPLTHYVEHSPLRLRLASPDTSRQWPSTRYTAWRQRRSGGGNISDGGSDGSQSETRRERMGTASMLTTADFFTPHLIMSSILAGINLTLWSAVVVARWRTGQRLESMEWFAIALFFMLMQAQSLLRLLGLLTVSARVIVAGALALTAIAGGIAEWRRWSRVVTPQQRRIARLTTATLVMLVAANLLLITTLPNDS